MADEPPRDRSYGTVRNLVLALTVGSATVLLLANRWVDERDAVIVVASVVAGLVALSIAVFAAYGPRAPAWIALGTAFVASRSVLTLATGRVFAARDALDHVYGLPLDIVREAHIPDDYVYSSYPALQLLLAETHLVTGLSLWSGASILALLLALATLAFVVRLADLLWPRSGLFAGIGLLVAFFGILPGQLYQPLTLSVLFLAAMSYLVVNDRMGWAAGFFVLAVVMLGLSHPYSAVIIGILVFGALAVSNLTLRQRRFVLPMAVVLSLGILYVAFVSRDLDRFLDLLRPNDVPPLPVPGAGGTPSGGGGGGGGGDGAASPAPASPYSDAYLLVGAWAFRSAMGIALIGLVLAFLRWRHALYSKALLGLSGILYLVSRVLSYGFPTRVLTIASVAAAPFIGLAFFRSPRIVAIAVAAAMAMLAVTAPAATNQFFPWSETGRTVHALDDPAETADLVPYFQSIAGGQIRRSNPISSHPVFDHNDMLLVRAFASTDVAGHAPDTHYIFRDDAIDFGFSVTTTQSGQEARSSNFVAYPTDAQMAHLASIDRIGDFGGFALYRS